MKENKKIKRREPKSRRWKWQTSPLRNLSIQLVIPSLRIFLSYFAKCLTLLNNLENPHQSLSPWLSHSLQPYQANFMPQSFVHISLRQIKTKLKQINTLLSCLIMLSWMVCLCCVTFYLIVVRRATCVD
jgi:hypothetical protein